jgi:hypothetical protein
MLRLSVCLCLMASIALSASPIASRAQSLRSGEVPSSIILQTVSPPEPVLGADNRIHLAYELLATNASGLFVTLDKIEAMDQAGAVLATLERDALAKMIVHFTGKGTTLPPGVAAMIVMDVTFPPDGPLPQSIATRISATRAKPGPDGEPAPLEPDFPFPAQFVFTGASVPVGKSSAIFVEPPLRGDNWVVDGGCCETVTPCRGTVLVVNGKLFVPQRFAIDWFQLDAEGRDVTGDPSRLSSYPSFGAPIYSASDGVVVNLYDGAPEQMPDHPKGIRPENVGGNMLVVDVGNGAYAFYGHLQPGSVRVKLGDHVQAGEVIGLLGNTGNSTGPHLHFEIMDSPSPLNANGLPFVFPHFSSPGTVVEDAEIMQNPGKPLTIDKSRLAGSHKNQLPLNNEVVDFN